MIGLGLNSKNFYIKSVAINEITDKSLLTENRQSN